MVRRVHVANMPSTQRVSRVPRHNFYLRHTPWTIQPFLLAPVLPGETLKNAVMQVRAVSDPIKNPLIGWWLEHHLFYVKHRDLSVRDNLTEMMLDVHYDAVTAIGDSGSDDANTYYFGGSINWTQHCLECVVEHYFRNEGEAWNAATLDGMPVASISNDSWLDSADLASNYETGDVAIGLDATAETIQASDVQVGLELWHAARLQGLTDMTYEDYLRTYGVRPQAAEQLHRPEWLRTSKEWTYPTNTVDPLSGAPTSAVSWSVTERVDKDRFFKEPGFIFGVTVAKPKIYFSNLKGSAAGLMNSAMSWLPAVMDHMPEHSIVEVGSGDGPLQTTGSAYIVDVRDLLVYGDQFTNVVMSSEEGHGGVPLPTATVGSRYIAALQDVKDLFVDDDDPGTAYKIRQDGVINLNIAGRQVDHTPGTTQFQV